jgi:hypothetical protein
VRNIDKKCKKVISFIVQQYVILAELYIEDGNFGEKMATNKAMQKIENILFVG